MAEITIGVSASSQSSQTQLTPITVSNAHKAVADGKVLTERIAKMWQWDVGQVIQFVNAIPDGTEVQFDNGMVRTVENKICAIPNAILEDAGLHHAWLQVITQTHETTVYKLEFLVEERAKKDDYVEPDDEPSFRQWVSGIIITAKEKTDAALEIAESIQEYADSAQEIAKIKIVDSGCAKFDYFLTESNGNADDALDAAIAYCKNKSIHVIKFSPARYTFSRTHTITADYGNVLSLKSDFITSEFTGFVFNKTESVLFDIQSSGISFDGIVFYSGAYSQEFYEATNTFSNTTRTSSVSAITASKNVNIYRCIFRGFSSQAITIYNQSIITDCRFHSCQTAINVTGYDAQIRNVYITDCQYGIVSTETTSTIDVYALWADQIKYDVFRFQSLGGIVNGCIIDHIGRNAIRVASNINRLCVSGKISRCGLTASDSINNTAIVYSANIYNSKFDILTYERNRDDPAEDRTGKPEYVASEIVNCYISDNVVGSDVIKANASVKKTVCAVPGEIWTYGEDGVKKVLGIGGGGSGGSSVIMADNASGGVDLTINGVTKTLAKETDISGKQNTLSEADKQDIVKTGLTSGANWTQAEQHTARMRIGLDKEWVIKGTIAGDADNRGNIDSGVDVDLAYCTEIILVGEITGTNVSMLKCIISEKQYFLINNLATSGSRTLTMKFADSIFGIENIYARYANSLNSTNMSAVFNSYNNMGEGVAIANITRFFLTNPGNITSCDIKIYAR